MMQSALLTAQSCAAASWSRVVDQTPPVTAFTRFPGVDFQTAYDYNW